MRIIVCVKQVPDMNEAKIDKKNNTIMREGVVSITNPYDIHAVEEALRLKDTYGGYVTALSMGIPGVRDMLRQIIALGADDAVLLTDRAFAGSDTLATSYTLSRAINKIGKFDMVLCGKQTIDGDTAQVGPGLAEKLGVAHITNVIGINSISDGRMICKRIVDGGFEVLKIPLPAVITVEKEINTPRFPTINGIRKMKNANISTWSAADIDADMDRIGVKGSPTQVVRTFIPSAKVAAETITGAPAEQVEKLSELFNELHISAKM